MKTDYFQAEQTAGGYQVTFAEKPPELIRGMLKRWRMRWNPRGGFWWHRGAAGFADFCEALDKVCGSSRLVPCHKCGLPGRVISYGTGTYVFCGPHWRELLETELAIIQRAYDITPEPCPTCDRGEPEETCRCFLPDT